MQKIATLLLSLLLTACTPDPVIDASECGNGLTESEQMAGWRLLFDGHSLAQWRTYGEETANEGWGIENGCLTRLGWGGDLISREQFDNFELKLEWRISDSGNSGIFIRADESGDAVHDTGMEMQVLDNAGHWDRFEPTHRAGAFYDMLEPDHDTSQAVGYWNRVHIIARGPHVEFWLNDRKTAEFEQGSPAWRALKAESKFAERADWGERFTGFIGLQDHWDKVWYRNIRVLTASEPVAADEP
ncbi:MAG: DUF1080 domain-containing protein [Halioglobus sp.]